MTQLKYELGEQVKDKITGFVGTIVSRGDHISGCNTYGVTPKATPDGNLGDTKWFDEPRLERVAGEKKVIEQAIKTGADSKFPTTKQTK